MTQTTRERRSHRRGRFYIWNRIMMGVGYLSAAYWLFRGVVYLLVLLK